MGRLRKYWLKIVLSMVELVAGVRQYAETMARVVQAECPEVWEAFEDYRLRAVRLSGPEVEVLRHLAIHHTSEGGHTEIRKDHQLSKRELELFEKKLLNLGLGFLLTDPQSGGI